MGELRKDYILDRWVIISPKRGKRPHQLQQSAKTEVKTDFFAPGNEEMTPPEIGRVPKNGGWQLRWFENKFAALKPEGDPHIKTHNRFFTFADAYGHHEVIVETPRGDKQLAEFSAEGLEQVLHVYARRILEIEKKQDIVYVNVFKNHGYNAGTSLVHSHAQIIATSIVPPEIQKKLAAMRRFVSCPYCDIVQEEMKGKRACVENAEFAAFCPYASRFNYEVWVFPKHHIARFEDVNFTALAEVLSKVLGKLAETGLDYNMLIQYGPKGDDFHFHIEVCPRTAIWAGFEYASGIIINTVAPEDAAAFYRE